MTNYEAIRQMPPSRMAEFLDQVYLTGLHRGMYEERSKDDSVLDDNPFDLPWLMEDAEQATQWGTTEDGDLYMLNALVASIFRNARIEDTPETQSSSRFIPRRSPGPGYPPRLPNRSARL